MLAQPQTISERLYETDFHTWTLNQATALQAQNWAALDLENLIEEIASLGRQERRELRNRLGILLGHLLKWQFQPEKQSKSWKATIREQRHAVNVLLKENPSLKPYLSEAIIEAYEFGLALVVRETPLDYEDLPQDCPYTIEQVLNQPI